MYQVHSCANLCSMVLAGITVGVACARSTHPSTACADPSVAVQSKERAAARIQAAAPPGALQLLVTPDGSSDSVRVTLKNTSMSTLWINNRLSPGGKKGINREIWMEITDLGTGRTTDTYQCKGRSAFPSQHNYILLPPLAAYTGEVVLDCYLSREPAQLRVIAHYHDPQALRFVPPMRALHVPYEVISEPVEVSYEPLERGEPGR